MRRNARPTAPGLQHGRHLPVAEPVDGLDVRWDKHPRRPFEDTRLLECQEPIGLYGGNFSMVTELDALLLELRYTQAFGARNFQRCGDLLQRQLAIHAVPGAKRVSSCW